MTNEIITKAKERFRNFIKEKFVDANVNSNGDLYLQSCEDSEGYVDSKLQLEIFLEQEIRLALSEYEKGLREKIESMISAIGNPEGFNESATWSKGRKEGLEIVSNLLSESSQQQ